MGGGKFLLKNSLADLKQIINERAVN